MKKNQRERGKERERVKGCTVCEAWAWVQTGRVSGHSPWVERSERVGTLWNTEKKDEYKRHSRDYQRRRKAGPASRVGRIGSNSQKFMARRFDLRARGVTPGSYRSRKIYATLHRKVKRSTSSARAL